jgi:Rrf2 family protein
MFSIHKESDYALITVSSLRNRDDFVSITELVSETKMPRRFLARITADLVRHRILVSREGRMGGYKLAKKLKDINLYDFLSIFEKNISVVRCVEKGYICNCKDSCKHHSFFADKLSRIIASQLKKWTLEDVFNT